MALGRKDASCLRTGDRETLFITKLLPAIHTEMKRLEQHASKNGSAVSKTYEAVKSGPVRSIDPDLALLTGV
jgi:hypothetical protein